MRQVHPGLVEEYDQKRGKHTKKAPRKRAVIIQQDALDGRARALDDEYLAINSYVSTAPSNEAIDPMAESSLPLRACGFVLFTWPDPDDPDDLVVDSERDDLPTGVGGAV